VGKRRPVGPRTAMPCPAHEPEDLPAPARVRGRPGLEGGLMTVSSTVHGFPRIGDRREMKTATEGYWAGGGPAGEVEATPRELRRQTCTFLRDAGIGQVPSNHFSLYDQVLDTCVLVG